MSESDVKRLQDLIKQAPENMMLKVALVRRLVSLNQDSEALSIALGMDISCVRAASDRRILADLFRRAGLDDRAEQLNDDQHTMLGDEPAFERPNSNLEATDCARAPEGRARLRLVGGTDVSKKRSDP